MKLIAALILFESWISKNNLPSFNINIQNKMLNTLQLNLRKEELLYLRKNQLENMK